MAIGRAFRGRRPGMAHLAAVGLCCCAGGGSACAEVLYDTREMVAVAEGWNRAWLSVIGGMGFFGSPRDNQTADDFTLAAKARLGRVTVDFIHSGATPADVPAGGFLVEFFPDVGERPSDGASISVSTMSFTLAGTFAQGAPPQSSQEPPWRSTFIIDLGSNNVVLPAGQWWISVQALDDTPFGSAYAWAGQSAPAEQFGAPTHHRGGGQAHGNGYPGETNNWFIGPVGSSARQQSMRVESAASGDLDGDGVIGSGDLAIVLGAWGACGQGGVCPADLDDDGMVGSSDLALILGAWGQGG